MNGPGPKESGSGSRPTTDGGVDNIGAGGAFDVGRAATGEPNEGPSPAGRMRDKKADAEAERHDDSVPLDLHGDKRPETNTEPPPRHDDDDERQGSGNGNGNGNDGDRDRDGTRP